MSNSVLNLGSATVRQLDGLYSLNDLHQASGGEEKNAPSNFMRLDQTQAIIAELCSAEMQIMPAKTVRGRGKQQGTYVCKELVYAYANWISAAFYLKMIRFFDAMHAPAMLEPATVSRAQLGEMSQRMADRFPDGKDKPYAWSRFNNHFRLASYKDLPKEKFEAACAYIDQMPVKAASVTVNAETEPKKIAQPVISDYLQLHINRKTHEIALGQYDAIRGIITEAVQGNLNCGAAESDLHDYIDSYGDAASDIVVMNKRDVFMLASQTTNLLNTAGQALETIHRLESHLGSQLYLRKEHGKFGHYGLPESLVESVISAAQGQGVFA